MIQTITNLYQQVAEPPNTGTIGVLTPDEKEKLVAKIVSSSPPALAETMMKIPLIKSCVKAIILQDIDSQCQKLCQKKENPSVLRMTKDSQKELNKFQWISILTEMKEKAPDVQDMLSAVALPNVKADGSQVPRICTAYGVLMNTRYCKILFQLYFFPSHSTSCLTLLLNMLMPQSQFDLCHCFNILSLPEWVVHMLWFKRFFGLKIFKPV